jgi:hypothetical protein
VAPGACVSLIVVPGAYGPNEAEDAVSETATYTPGRLSLASRR